MEISFPWELSSVFLLDPFVLHQLDHIQIFPSLPQQNTWHVPSLLPVPGADIFVVLKRYGVPPLYLLPNHWRSAHQEFSWADVEPKISRFLLKLY